MMTICKDCIHHNVCIWENELEEESNEHCTNFKNKADFVEVGRCEKCKNGFVSTFSVTKDGEERIACYCNLKKRVTELDSYCPRGERK